MTHGSSKRSSAPRPGFGRGGGPVEDARDIKKTIRRLLTYLKPYTWQLVLVTVFVLLGTVLNLLGPMLFGQAVDLYIIPRDLDGLGRLVLILLGIYLGANITSAITGYIMLGISQKLIRDIRFNLFAHLQMLSMDYHDEHETGDLMSRMTNDTDAINQVLSNGMTQLVTNILSLIGILIAMFLLSWQLAIASLLVIPLMVIITGTIAKRSREAFRSVQMNLGKLNANAEENISGVRVVKAFAREDETIREFQKVNEENREAGIKAESITALLMPLINIMRSFSVALIAGVGGYLALGGVVSVGVIVAFMTYMGNFFQPLRSLAQLYNQLQSALAGAERVFDVLDSMPKVKNKANALPLPRIKGSVVFEDVSFSYEEGKPVLEHVSLEAKPGDTIALVGPTGAGKTTIISLLSRFYDVDEGRILIDGHDIRDITAESLRGQLGIVLQDTTLFTGSVMQNIRFGRLDATDEEVYQAARLANADHFIRRLPEGYDTIISEQGSNFSQGQKQLFAIARAILADPAILILDEATSSVDTRTEMHIQEALLRLMEGRTAFVIAHRLSTIREADHVLVINDHRIIEQGDHDSLLEQEGFYHNLYMSQFKRAQDLAEKKIAS